MDGSAGSAGSASGSAGSSSGSGGSTSLEEGCGAVGGAGGGWQLEQDGAPPPAAAGDPATLIKDLSDSEAQAWCEWYVASYLSTGNGAPLAESDPTQESGGFVTGLGGMFCTPAIGPTRRCFALPKVSDCVRNLRHVPCEAPIAMASDCAISYFDPFKKLDCPLSGCGSVCDALLAVPSCEGTVLSVVVEAQGDCLLAVE